MQLEFNPIRIEDRAVYRPILYSAPDRGCEYTFSNIFSWRNVYGTSAALTDDKMLIVRFEKDVGEGGAYLFPIGCGDLKSGVSAMMQYSAEKNEKFTIIAARREDVDELAAAFGDIFTCHTSRDFAEYVYNSTDLINLAGKKYHAKRNHISRFDIDNPGYKFCEITAENLPRVREMSERWYDEVIAGESAGSTLPEERQSADEIFKNYFELGLSGGFVETAEGIVAYSMGEPICDSTFCVHIEKAKYDVAGAYTVINRDFAAHFCGDYQYINREDDVGDEGLRRSKLSYYPVCVTEKFVVHLK